MQRTVRIAVGSAFAALLALAGAAPALAVSPSDVGKLDITNAGPQPAHLDTGGLGGFGRMFLGLIVVLAVIGVVYLVLRRVNRGRLPGRRGTGALEVLSTTPLSPSRHLHVVRVGERVLLIGSTDHGITALQAFDRDAAVDEGLLDDDLAPDRLDADVSRALALVGGPPATAVSNRRRLFDTLRERTLR